MFTKQFEKKSNSEEIKVKEFTHDDLKETQYIDEQNNIWNDIHKKIGYLFKCEGIFLITIFYPIKCEKSLFQEMKKAGNCFESKNVKKGFHRRFNYFLIM